MELNQLIGHEILILTRWFSDEAKEFESVLLHGVEVGGIWIETKNVNSAVLKRLNTNMLDLTPVVFLPYHNIEALVATVQKTLLSDNIAQ